MIHLNAPSAPSGELRITAPNDFAIIVLPEVLAQFSRRCPEIRMDVRVANRVVDLVGEEFDVAIRGTSTQLKDSSLTRRKLGSIGSRVFASPAYLARRGRPRQLGDERHDWIVHPSLTKPFKKSAQRLRRFLCDDFVPTRNLVRDGAGVRFLPSFVAAPYVCEGLIEEVHTPGRRHVSEHLRKTPLG